MTPAPDTTVVELHRLPGGRARIASLDGAGFRLVDDGRVSSRLEVGSEVEVGETIALGAGATARIGDLVLRGGKRGLAHAFVDDSAFRSSPGRADVPKLLAQLEQIEAEMRARLGADPLLGDSRPTSADERLVRAEFARTNLVVEEARLLPEGVARAEAAVVLFLCGEAAFVAVTDLSLAKLRTLMRVLGRPVNPHVVDPDVLGELFSRAYAVGTASTPS
ncbi:hypothetical protein L6R52_32205 [Myxococcota bacterium]|nr:hypothetical protein [Myxococcota bacterium]